MENQEKKSIAEKLDSLVDLPEGYHPNLNSKWSLLEESLHNRSVIRKRADNKWIKVAACILILFSVGVWIMFRKNEKMVQMHPVPVKHELYIEIPVKIQEDVSTGENRPGKKIHVKSAIVQKENQIHDTVKNQGNQQSFIVQEMETVDTASAVLSQIEKQFKEKKKRRYVQIDFDSPSSIPVASATATPVFRLRIGSANQNSTLTGFESGSTLRIKQNF
jgi:hypothetical protein